MSPVVSLPTVEQLCEHVHKILCEREQLDPAQAPLRRSLIKRSGRPCALFFQVRGPRRVAN
jgi:hypothetical protein